MISISNNAQWKFNFVTEFILKLILRILKKKKKITRKQYMGMLRLYPRRPVDIERTKERTF